MYLAIGIGIIVLVIVMTGYGTYGMFKNNYAIKFYSLFMFITLVVASIYMLFRLIKASM
ncbi:hypothetical protein ABFE25_29005 [Bacillus toyonensis]|uniref:hypothetical protein n=1 Tax=Bacillus toyonensis TaxID=155322 RepID=UPI00321A7763